MQVGHTCAPERKKNSSSSSSNSVKILSEFNRHTVFLISPQRSIPYSACH